jgi:hypothetical protein
MVYRLVDRTVVWRAHTVEVERLRGVKRSVRMLDVDTMESAGGGDKNKNRNKNRRGEHTHK